MWSACFWSSGYYRNTVFSTLFAGVVLAFGAEVSAIEMVLKMPDEAECFFDTGYPSCLRSSADGGILNLQGMPDYWYSAREIKAANAKEEIAGFTPTCPIYMRFNGIEDLVIEDECLITCSAARDQGIILVELTDEPKILPVRAKILRQTKDSYIQADMLAILPGGCLLKSNAHYALVVTDAAVRPDRQNNIKYAPLLKTLLGSNALGREGGSDLTLHWNSYQKLRQWLDKQSSFSAGQVIGAVCWETCDPSKFINSFLGKLDEFYGFQDRTLNLAYSAADSTDKYEVYKGYLSCPQFQRVSRPIKFPMLMSKPVMEMQDGDGWYKVHGTRPLPVALVLPADHDGDINLVQYHHGTGGGSDEIYTRGIKINGRNTGKNNLAENFVKAGCAVACIGTFMAREHEEALGYIESAVMKAVSYGLSPCCEFLLELNHVFYNFTHLPSMSSNFLQSLSERRMFDRVVAANGIWLEGKRDDRLKVKSHTLLGHSFGAMTSAVLATVYPDQYKGLILSAGGQFGIGLPAFFLKQVYGMNALSGKGCFGVPPSSLVENLFHPVWMQADMILGHVSPAAILALHQPSLPVLVISGGDEDNQVPPFMQEPLLLAAGVDFKKPDGWVQQGKGFTFPVSINEGEYMRESNAGVWLQNRFREKHKRTLVRFDNHQGVNSHNSLFQRKEAGQLCQSFVKSITGSKEN